MKTEHNDQIVTIGLSSYNYGRYIGDAIESVVNQTAPNWQLNIYDNGSTDNTYEVIEPYLSDPRVNLYIHPENIGARNNSLYAAKHADTAYFAFLQADDYLEHDFVEKALTQFAQHPDTPYVFFDWNQYFEASKTSHGHDRFPFRGSRSGLTSAAPFLTVCNFVPLHMAVFRTACLKYGYDYLVASPLKQVMEQFLLKLLEDKYGPPCYSGSLGGVWRRHDEQVTVSQIENRVAYIEEPVERSWYANQAPDPDYINVFLCLANSLFMSSHASLFKAADWLMHSDGQRFAESYGIPVRAENRRLQTFVLIVVLKFRTFTSVSLCEHGEIEAWMKKMGIEFDPDAVKNFLTEIMYREGQALLDDDEINAISHMLFTGKLLQDAESVGSVLSRDLSNLKALQSQTGMSLISIAKSMIDTRRKIFSNELEKEEFLLNAVQVSFESITFSGEKKALSVEESGQLAELLKLLYSKEFKLTSDIALSVRNVIRKWQQNHYYQQWRQKHTLQEVDAEVFAERMMLHWHNRPMLHCVMFVLPGEEALLADTIDSLANQMLPTWRLSVLAANPSPDLIFDEVENLNWFPLSPDMDPYDGLNQVISAFSDDWVSFVEPGIQYSPHSFIKIADFINANPECSFVYTDDDYIDSLGERTNPRFKPDINLDLLRASPYIGKGWVPARYLSQMGGIRRLPGAENYDLALRWLDYFGESAFCHIPDVLTHKSEQVDRPFDSIAGRTALEAHFERRQLEVEIQEGYVDNSYRVEYQHKQQPLVSVIIPTRDKLEFFQPCIESLLNKTGYENFEVLVVDNQSSDVDTLNFYDYLREFCSDRVRVLQFDKPFNFSAINNFAVEQALGDYLVLLNNDTEIIQSDWIERMLNHALREEVGVVGARLVYPESGQTQHVGVVLGISDVADHPYNGLLGLNDSSHMERARLDQNFSAVTAALMMVRKDLYQKVGGMNAYNLAVLYNDVDLCLKIGEIGFKVVWTPYAVAIHHGNTSVGGPKNVGFYTDFDDYLGREQRFRSETRYMLNNWLGIIRHDPAYNPNLSLRYYDYRPDTNAPLNWELHHHLRLRVFGVPLKGGSGEYRMRQPFQALTSSGKASCETGSYYPSISELCRLQPDTVVVQNAISDSDIDKIRMYREFSPETLVVFLLDDLIHNLPEKSSQYKPLKAAYRDAKTRLRSVLSFCDRLIVSTEPLADMCRDMIKNIDIIPNRIQKERWSLLPSMRQQSDKPRVGWAGAQQHQGDLEIIIDVVKETAEEIDWIFFGMCPDEIKPYIKEEHAFVDIEAYPKKLASLNLDLAVAPLEDHDFNIAKSNLRLLEYGILGWPVVCSDIFPYQTNDAPVVRVANNKAAWLAAIRQILADPVVLQQAGASLKAWVQQYYLLEDHLDEWFLALANPEFKADHLKAEKTEKQLFSI